MNGIILVIQALSLLGYFIYYIKSGVTGDLTFLFLGVNFVASVFVSKIVAFSILAVIIVLYMRKFGNGASRVIPIVTFLLFTVPSFFISYVIEKKFNWNYFINTVYLVVPTIIYFIELSYVIYKEEYNNEP